MPWFTANDVDWLGEESNLLQRHLEDLELLRERLALINQERVDQYARQSARRVSILTLLGGLFLPATFLTGLMGMNVGGIPLAESATGFWIMCAIITAVVVAMIIALLRMR